MSLLIRIYRVSQKSVPVLNLNNSKSAQQKDKNEVKTELVFVTAMRVAKICSFLPVLGKNFLLFRYSVSDC